MNIAELQIAPRTKGRAAAPLSLEFVRNLEASDLALMASERAIQPTSLIRIRDRHHALARCLASGMSNTEAGAVTGYDASRISILKADPTFQALIADYRTGELAAQADFIERTTTLSLTAIENLQSMLEDDANPLSAQTQLEIAKFSSDRVGHAPVSRSLNVNVSANMGDRLAAARARANALLKDDS